MVVYILAIICQIILGIYFITQAGLRQQTSLVIGFTMVTLASIFITTNML